MTLQEFIAFRQQLGWSGDVEPILEIERTFELLLTEAAERAPLGELVDIMDVGFACAYLATTLARRITGGPVYVDGGANIIA